MDKSKTERKFGFRAKMDFEEGLKKAIEWYEKIFFKGIDIY